jgi:hypothetical protein
MCWEAESGDSIGSLARILNENFDKLNKYFQKPNVEAGQVYDISGFYRNNTTVIRANIVQVFLVAAPPPPPVTWKDVKHFFSEEESRRRGRAVDDMMYNLLVPKCAQEGKCYVAIIYPGGVASGLRGASQGLTELYANGSLRNTPIITIRNTLTQSGFKQTVTMNGEGYLFRNAIGEEVRIINRGGAWDIRVRNAFGNYLDETGNVASPSATHGITVISK